MGEVTKLIIPKGGNYLSDIRDNNGNPYFQDGDGLPHGILNKQYTGVGATYHQLKSNQDSIIVFPRIQLAREKADNYQAFYVGSKENKSVSIEEIREYHKNTPEGRRKYCVVVDSIFKLKEALGEEVYNRFHLVLDEIDVIQGDSGFKNVLTQCYDEFKLYKSKTLVSATILGFSDDEIKELPIYEVHKEGYSKPNLTIQVTNAPFTHLSQRISSKIAESEESKILVGVNSVNQINELISYLEKLGLSKLISVICSDESRYKVDSQYDGIITEGKLPNRITICTSVIFSGIDIQDEHECLALSKGGKTYQKFSVESLYQLQGRGRNNIENTTCELIIDSSCIKPKEIRISENEIAELSPLIEYVTNNISNSALQKELIQNLGSVETPLLSKLLYENSKGSLSNNYLFHDLKNHEARLIKGYCHIDSLKRYFSERFDCRVEIIEDGSKDDPVDFGVQLNNYIKRLADKKIGAKKVHDILNDSRYSEDIRAASSLYFLGVTIENGQGLSGFFQQIKTISKGYNFSYFVHALKAAFLIYQSKYYNELFEALKRKVDKNGRVSAEEIRNTMMRILPNEFGVRFKSPEGKIDWMSSLVFRLAYGDKFKKSGSKKYQLENDTTPLILTFSDLLNKRLDGYRKGIKRPLFGTFGIVQEELNPFSVDGVDLFLDLAKD